MPTARGRHALIGQGDRPATSGGGLGGASSGGAAAGGGRSQARPLNKHLRYSPGEENALKRDIEKGLRLQRLEQVRQQSRKQAAAIRQEYRLRRETNKRVAVQESKVGQLFVCVLEAFIYCTLVFKIFVGCKHASRRAGFIPNPAVM